jgi:hypothetical protein
VRGHDQSPVVGGPAQHLVTSYGAAAGSSQKQLL